MSLGTLGTGICEQSWLCQLQESSGVHPEGGVLGAEGQKNVTAGRGGGTGRGRAGGRAPPGCDCGVCVLV